LTALPTPCVQAAVTGFTSTISSKRTDLPVLNFSVCDLTVCREEK